jgi:hypothetical protein
MALCPFAGSFKIWWQWADCQAQHGGAEFKKNAQILNHCRNSSFGDNCPAKALSSLEILAGYGNASLLYK